MIRPVNTINSPSFKAVCKVGVQKKAFSQPESIDKSYAEFSDCVSDALNAQDAPHRPVKKVIKPENIKIFIYPIGYGYTKVSEMSQYSPQWVENHTGIFLTKPPKDDFHSFYLMTKEDKDRVVEHLNKKSQKMNDRKIKNEYRLRKANGECADELWRCARDFQLSEEGIEKFDENEVSFAKLDRLAEVSELIDVLNQHDLI